MDRERVAEAQAAAPAQRLHDAGAPVFVAGDDAVRVAVNDREVNPLLASQRRPSRRRRERGPSRTPSGPGAPHARSTAAKLPPSSRVKSPELSLSATSASASVQVPEARRAFVSPEE